MQPGSEKKHPLSGGVSLTSSSITASNAARVGLITELMERYPQYCPGTRIPIQRSRGLLNFNETILGRLHSVISLEREVDISSGFEVVGYRVAWLFPSRLSAGYFNLKAYEIGL